MAEPSHSVDEERRLVAAARRGDRAAFGQLVVVHQKALFGFAWRRLRDVEEARDLAQRVLVRAYESLDSFRGESRLRTWLFSIAVHFALDVQRASSRTLPVDAPAPPSQAPELLSARDRALRLRAEVARLPDKQRLVVELRAFEELTFREVAEVLGISEDAAKANFHHALVRLREEMGTEP